MTAFLTLGAMAVAAGISLFAIVAALVGTRPAVRVSAGGAGLACRACGYALYETTLARCSECGADLSATGAMREASKGRIRSWRTISWSLVISMLVIAALLMAGRLMLSSTAGGIGLRVSSLAGFEDEELACAVTGGRLDLPFGATVATVADELAARAQRGALSYDAMRILTGDLGVPGGFADRCRQAYAMKDEESGGAVSAQAGPQVALDPAEAAALRGLVESFARVPDLPSSSLSRLFEHVLGLELTVLDTGNGMGLVVVAPGDEYRAPTQASVLVRALGGELLVRGSSVPRPLAGERSDDVSWTPSDLVVCCAGFVPLAELGIVGSDHPFGERVKVTVDGALRVDCEIAAASVAFGASAVRTRLAPREIGFARLEKLGDRGALEEKIRRVLERGTIDPATGAVTLRESDAGDGSADLARALGARFTGGTPVELSLDDIELGFLSPELVLVIDGERHPTDSAVSRYTSSERSGFHVMGRQIASMRQKLRDGARAEIELSLVELHEARGSVLPGRVNQLTAFMERYGVRAAFGGPVPAGFAPRDATAVPKVQLLDPPFAVRVPLRRVEASK